MNMCFLVPIQTYQWFDLALKAIIAGAASVIAYNQYKVAKDKLRFDLFEKRFALFNSVYESLLSVIGENPNQIDYKVNVRISREAQFLFGKEVGEYISELNRTTQKYVLHHNRANSMNKAFSEKQVHHKDRDKENDAAENYRVELVKELDRMPDVFRPYLGMHHRT
jgi:hypothetical protein